MHSRPSALLSLDNDYYAYCFDEVCVMWGTHIQTKLAEVKGKNEKEIRGRQELMLKRLLDPTTEGKQFANPVATVES